MMKTTELKLGDMDNRYANMEYWEDGKMIWKFTNWWKQKVADIQEKDNTITFVIKRQAFSVPAKHRFELNQYFQRVGYKVRNFTPLENGYTIQDWLDKLNFGNYSVGYGDSRTIERAHFRECSAFVLSLFGGVVIFPINKGFVAYRVVNHCGPNMTKISVKDAIDFLIEAEEKGYGKTYWQDGIKDRLLHMEQIKEDVETTLN